MNEKRKLELHEELKEARKKLRMAQGEMDDANLGFVAARTVRNKARDVVEEILEEIETGKAHRPLLELCGNGRPAIDAVTVNGVPVVSSPKGRKKAAAAIP